MRPADVRASAAQAHGWQAQYVLLHPQVWRMCRSLRGALPAQLQLRIVRPPRPSDGRPKTAEPVQPRWAADPLGRSDLQPDHPVIGAKPVHVYWRLENRARVSTLASQKLNLKFRKGDTMETVKSIYDLAAASLVFFIVWRFF